MTISDLSQEKIKEEPSIPREITEITQSLRFVDQTPDDLTRAYFS